MDKRVGGEGMSNKTPLSNLWKALASAVSGLGINDPDKEFPYILIDQLELTDSFVSKDAKSYEATFVIDVVTSSDSPEESIGIIESVREVIAEGVLQVEGFIVDSLKAEALTPIHDMEEGVWRQVQRYRIVLLTN